MAPGIFVIIFTCFPHFLKTCDTNLALPFPFLIDEWKAGNSNFFVCKYRPVARPVGPKHHGIKCSATKRNDPHSNQRLTGEICPLAVIAYSP
jgi:hypothetical protein